MKQLATRAPQSPNRNARRRRAAGRSFLPPTYCGVKNMARRLRSTDISIEVRNPERYLHASRTR